MAFSHVALFRLMERLCPDCQKEGKDCYAKFPQLAWSSIRRLGG